ncbi:hypothetical protein ACIRRA_12985 [Nocardia sp. NPDC101769]|uniref:hypothetical protein n=1 Tax=Nocardia sp. NPDC101769 TaxID=3364333 RepID=UPI00382E0E02
MNDYYMVGGRNRVAAPMSPAGLAVVVLLGFVFAAGLYLGLLLFGTRESLPTTVVTCPAPGTQQAVWPQGCPREAVAP